MADEFSNQSTDKDDPADHAFAVTPHNSTNFTNVARALYIGGEGNITLVTNADEVVLFTGLLAGSILPVKTKRVNSTGTTATNIVGLY